MTCDEWKKFIQVNIYGQTLQGLQQQGIALETMLSDIGCSKVWIVEGKMYNDDSCHQTTNSNEVSIVTPPVLSTTIADVKCPRFSTPAVSQVDLQRKFTLNLPIKFSEINSSYDEDFDCSHYSDDEINENNDIGELMNDIIQKVSESDKETAIEQTIFSSTINEMNVPRCSTPIIPHIDHHRTFTLNIPDTVSAIVLNEDGDIETDQSIDESATNNHVMKELSDFAGTQFEHNYELSPVKKVPTPRAGTKSLMTVTKSKKLILKRKSAASKLASTSVISRKQRVVLKESTSTDRMKNIRKILKKETSVIPTVENRTQSIQKEIPVSNIKRELSNGNTSQLYSKNVDNLFSVKRELSPIYVMYVGDDIMDYGGEEDTMILDHQEEVVTENLEAVDNQDDDEKEHEDENEHFSGDETAENRNACANKRVSFAEPLIQSSNRKKAEMNKVHIVKCHYDGCNKSYTWRMKYGKTRLVDHAFTHVSHLVLKCNLCEQTFQKIRSVRYHHKKSHPETKLEGCGIKRALDTSRDGTDFVQVWDKCYKNNISLCGAGDLNPFARQDKGIKKGNRVRSTRNSMNPELGSNVVEEEDENGEVGENKSKFL
uniref:ZIM-1 n=1 Tax=Caenorhabditis remanei TaxID=31234 RepID=A1A689_CAERE|nr:TPA_inf: ZIM-1 [Caenorhabditis remanei]